MFSDCCHCFVFSPISPPFFRFPFQKARIHESLCPTSHGTGPNQLINHWHWKRRYSDISYHMISCSKLKLWVHFGKSAIIQGLSGLQSAGSKHLNCLSLVLYIFFSYSTPPLTHFIISYYTVLISTYEFYFFPDYLPHPPGGKMSEWLWSAYCLSG